MRKWGSLLIVVVSGVAWLAGSRPATASIEMQKAAKAAGVQVANCAHCHTDKLPKKDAHELNDVGKWLQAEKDKRKADKVDGGWLKDYKAPEKK